MRRSATLASRHAIIITAAALSCSALAGCGDSTTLPSGHTISVPSVDAPSLPALPEVDLSKTDQESARKGMCAVTDYWLRADDATKKLARPYVEKVITQYEASNDETTQLAARTARSLLSADSASDAKKRAVWNDLCSKT